MNHKIKKYFLRILLMSALFMLVFGSTGVSAAQKTGFVTEKGKSYYIKKDGSKQKGWLELNGKKYYFDKKTGVQLKGWAKNSKGQVIRYFSKGSGVMAEGFLKDSKGITRYFEPKTGLLARGFKEIKGKTYYFTSGVGAMMTGWAEDSKGQKRYFSKSGKMATGWLKNSKDQYRYFNTKNGVMYVGLKKIESYYYYFDKKTGLRYQKGFLEVDGKTYYFSKSNGKAQTKWLELDGKKYYFDKTGVMYKNTTFELGGKKYSADGNGVVTEVTASEGNGKYQYTVHSEYGGYVKAYDPQNGRYYYLAKEFATHSGVANGEKTDRDLLAAICEAEAGDQGLIGMEAVALCILNRTIEPTREFPSDIRMVLYEQGNPKYYKYPQYSPVRNGALLERLNGNYYNKTLAYQAADEALEIFEDYVKFKKPRTLKGFDRKDFNFMYFMMEDSFWKQPLDFKKVDNFLYKDHMFFVDWVSPRK